MTHNKGRGVKVWFRYRDCEPRTCVHLHLYIPKLHTCICMSKCMHVHVQKLIRKWGWGGGGGGGYLRCSSTV